MAEVSLVCVQTSLADRLQAEALAEKLISAKLAACAQVGGPVISIYNWQGVMHKEQEYLVAIKTIKARQTAVVESICAHHPYTTPEVIVTPISFASKTYLDWVMQTCADA